MYREFYEASALLELPVVAMALFALVFLGAVWRAFSSERTGEQERLSRLPLEPEEHAPQIHGGKRHAG